jgi:threonine dehydratase
MGHVSLTLADIRAAQERLVGVARITPMRDARWLTDRVGSPVMLKCENLQRAGSFKIRGAYNRMAQLTDEERSRGVVAASAGNHAQGVALAAQLLGIPSTVFMPIGAPIPKVAATRAYGADVKFVGTVIDEALTEAISFAEESGAILIHPFDHEHIVAGQGTMGLEILDQCPDVTEVFVCTGGGGLLAGTALAIKELRPEVRIVGVQASGAAAYPMSLQLHAPTALQSMNTMADGIAVGRPGVVPFALVEQYVDDVITVDDEHIAQALLLLLERSKLVVEPAGAAAVAALLDHRWSNGRVVATVSGGNIDPLLLLRVIRHGLAAAGRYLSLRVRVPDRPGSLATLLADISGVHANVVEVEHVRTDPRLAVDEVDIALHLETRGPSHRDEVLATLEGHGYRVIVG